MNRWIVGVLVGVALLPLGAGGCGGSEDSSNLTKAEFVEQANQICAKREKEWANALASYSKELTKNNAGGNLKKQEQLAEVVLQESMLPALIRELEALEGLGLPEEGEEKVAAMLKRLSAGVAKIEDQGAGSVAAGLEGFEKEAEEFGVKC